MAAGGVSCNWAVQRAATCCGSDYLHGFAAVTESLQARILNKNDMSSAGVSHEANLKAEQHSSIQHWLTLRPA